MKTADFGCNAIAFEQGKTGHFNDLFERYYAALCFYAGRFVFDAALAEEIVADAYVKLWQRCAVQEEPMALRSYLYASVRNASINEFRKWQVRNEVLDRYTYMVKDELENSVLDNLLKAELLNNVYAAIRDLPRQCKRIMLMLFEEGKPSREIAREMNLSVSTIKNQKARGLMLVKKKIGGF